MSSILIYRLRNLDRELVEMLNEADGKCSIQYALMMDEIRERLSDKLEAIANSEARLMRRFADKDPQGKFVPSQTGGLMCSTAEQQEQLDIELSKLINSSVELDLETLPRLNKADLIENGISASGKRIANLRPILDLSPSNTAEEGT